MSTDYAPYKTQTYENGQTKERERRNKEAFRIRMMLELDLDLANALGNFILDSRCTNPAIVAIGHQLVGS